MAVVEDAFGVGRVVLEAQGLEGAVVLGLRGNDVDGRLPRPVGYRKLLGPFIGPCRGNRETEWI